MQGEANSTPGGNFSSDLLFTSFCFIAIHNGPPRGAIPLGLTVKLRHLCSEFSPPVDEARNKYRLCLRLSVLGLVCKINGLFRTSQVAQIVKCPPARRETWVQSLGWEDPLEKEMTTHSSTLAWKMPWTEEPGGLQSMGSQRFGHDWMTDTHLSFIYVCLSIFYLRSVFSYCSWGSQGKNTEVTSHSLLQWAVYCQKESWVLKNCCFWTVVLKKTLESPLDCKEIHPVHPKGNQSWIFIRRTDREAETPILWAPDAKIWLIGKDRDAGKDWGQEEKGTTEGEMVGWHHRLYGHEFEQAPGVGDGQGGLACCGPWGRRESDTTEQLNWTVFYLCLTICLLSVSVYLLSMSFCLSIFSMSVCLLTICLLTHINITGCASLENAS